MKKLFLGLILIGSLYAAEKTVVIKVENMSCPLCTTAVKRSLMTTPGVISAKVRLNTKSATVVYDDSKTSPEKLLHSIDAVGYTGKIESVKETK